MLLEQSSGVKAVWNVLSRLDVEKANASVIRAPAVAV